MIKLSVENGGEVESDPYNRDRLEAELYATEETLGELRNDLKRYEEEIKKYHASLDPHSSSAKDISKIMTKLMEKQQTLSDQFMKLHERHEWLKTELGY